MSKEHCLSNREKEKKGGGLNCAFCMGKKKRSHPLASCIPKGARYMPSYVLEVSLIRILNRVLNMGYRRADF